MTSKKMRSGARSFAVTGGVILALVLSACTTGQGDQSPPTGGPKAAVAEEVTANVAASTHEPEFVAPGPAIDVSSLAGKSMFVIPETANPFTQSMVDAMNAAAKKAGMKVTVYPTQGTPSQWVQGMNAALSGKADIINLVGIDARVLQPQLQAAKKAGIPVVITHIYDDSEPQAPACDGCEAGVTALVTAPFFRAGVVAADWIIADSGGQANILILGAPDVPVSPGTIKGIEERLSKFCSDCKSTVINIPVAEWNTGVQGEVQTALNRDPSINYVYPLYDAMVAGAVPAIRTTGKTGQVKVVSYNGSTFALKFIQDGDIVAMDVGEDSTGIGYASMDQVFRILLDKPIVDARTPIRIWDKTNVKESGTPPVTGKGYGNAYENGYLQLWGLK